MNMCENCQRLSDQNDDLRKSHNEKVHEYEILESYNKFLNRENNRIKESIVNLIYIYSKK
jgi:hypothetical protein